MVCTKHVANLGDIMGGYVKPVRIQQYSPGASYSSSSVSYNPLANQQGRELYNSSLYKDRDTLLDKENKGALEDFKPGSPYAGMELGPASATLYMMSPEFYLPDRNQMDSDRSTIDSNVDMLREYTARFKQEANTAGKEMGKLDAAVVVTYSVPVQLQSASSIDQNVSYNPNVSTSTSTDPRLNYVGESTSSIDALRQELIGNIFHERALLGHDEMQRIQDFKDKKLELEVGYDVH